MTTKKRKASDELVESYVKFLNTPLTENECKVLKLPLGSTWKTTVRQYRKKKS